jgi:peptidyl-prolyl cis-trans isomerase B (cyclophilin B)
VASNKDRQRQLARERYERRQAREVARRARTRQTTKWVSVIFVVIVLAGVVTLTALHLSSSSASSPGKTPSASASASPSLSPSASPSPSASESVSASGTVKCAYTPSGTAARKVGTPPSTTSVKPRYQATIKTNRGTVVVDLLNTRAPCTVNSFAYLAGKAYFSNTPCHRLTTTGIYVLQCGDPTGTGTGGPGYEFADENLAGATYPAGTVAMANSGPNTNGSQFFLVYKNTPLPASYTPFGTIVSGLNVIQAIASKGTDNSNGSGDGHPNEKVTIESITIKKT